MLSKLRYENILLCNLFLPTLLLRGWLVENAAFFCFPRIFAWLLQQRLQFGSLSWSRPRDCH
jgi:hypothetical protein